MRFSAILLAFTLAALVGAAPVPILDARQLEGVQASDLSAMTGQAANVGDLVARAESKDEEPRKPHSRPPQNEQEWDQDGKPTYPRKPHSRPPQNQQEWDQDGKPTYPRKPHSRSPQNEQEWDQDGKPTYPRKPHSRPPQNAAEWEQDGKPKNHA
ncbi:uncharacterized protein PFL1_03579 [Pseudozyma flocculosa PF-1]|uniref:Uncharacterized protein n=1 Tax=Pseudozyma flocculosa PF-1 TaxID=1277687 RepID=A0A061HDR5_9BASI|nr:uncharacterized protein PFL1_03579 [Pseudozyma flocculosa PF-1]EPQ28776.1 hypothetical protein PFL1_03579 [Pseudozyma flocculosa PF-1]